MDADLRRMDDRQCFNTGRAVFRRGHAAAALRSVLVPTHFHVPAGGGTAARSFPLRPERDTLCAAARGHRFAVCGLSSAADCRGDSREYPALRAGGAVFGDGD